MRRRNRETSDTACRVFESVTDDFSEHKYTEFLFCAMIPLRPHRKVPTGVQGAISMGGDPAGEQCGIYFFEFCTSPFSDVGVIQGEAKVRNGQWGIRNFPEGNL